MQMIELSHRISWMKAVVAGLSIGCCLAAAPAMADSTANNATDTALVLGVNAFPAYTAPSEKRAQTFDLPGVVQKVLVKEGDRVKAGQLVANQDIDADEAHLKGLELVANSNLEIAAEQATQAKDVVDLKRKTKLNGLKAISPEEYDQAVLQVEIDKDKVAHAQEDKKKAAYDVTEQKARIEQKKLYATIDGIVSEINTHAGELANSDTQHPTMIIVKNDPVYVEVDLPADVVKKLKAMPKQSLQIRYVDESDQNAWHEARIHFIKPEADPKSNTEHVQLEMANPQARSAGLQVIVRLPADLAPAAGATAANQ